jgi:hypothetical protein
MPYRCSPTTPVIDLTHHIILTVRSGKKIGLILCNEKGEPYYDGNTFTKIPVETTAQKQTSGSSSYDIFDYPYSPIVQDDLSGGRGSLDFERDSTKYYDSFRTKTGRANKAFAGPQEQWTSGLRSQTQNMPGNVSWHELTGSQRYLYHRFAATGTYTAGLAWILTRIKSTPADLTVKIYSDNAGTINASLATITVPYTRMNDILSEWLNETVSQALTDGVYYWMVIYAAASDTADKHWKIAVKNTTGSTYYSETFTTSPIAASVDLYFRLTNADTDTTCILVDYKELPYAIVSPASGAPTVYKIGDRGAADSNAGQLTKLIDATKGWTVDEWAGFVLKIIDGTGATATQPWRTIISNTSTELVFADDLAMDTTTEYVILGTKQTSLGACGLTAPVTSVLVSTTGVLYCCQGDSVTVRRLRAYNDSGTYRDLDDAANCQADETATTKALFMVYKPVEKKIIIGNNRDASSNVSTAKMSNASVPAWGTALTWAAAVNIDSKYIRMNQMVVYPDTSGNEAVWILKEDLPYVLKTDGTVEPVSVDEMKAIRSDKNGRVVMRQGVYLYLPLGYGLVSYYGGTFTDMGPNLGEGLSTERRGPTAAMAAYPGKFFLAIDAGSTGYSCVLASGGWHEQYRAPMGQRIRALFFQPTPGSSLDRLWIYQGNDLIWLPFPSETTNELEDSSYLYTPEFSVTLSRMHAGIYDVQKLVNRIKLQTEALEVNGTTGKPVCWFELDYRLNQDDDWTMFTDTFTTSPTQEINLTEQYGLAGKRLQLRLRGYTTDATKTPVFLAMIIGAVIRVDVKHMWGPFNVRLMDEEKLLSRDELDEYKSAVEKRKDLEAMGDASNDSLVHVESVSSLLHDEMIFLNVGTTRQILFARDESNPGKKDVFITQITMQEA